MLKSSDPICRALAITATLTALTSCGGTGAVDMAPVGMGLKFIGIGLVVMALVFVLGLSRN